MNLRSSRSQASSVEPEPAKSQQRNGAGHVDLYMGIGEEAKRKSSALHHYGEIWLLLKK